MERGIDFLILGLFVILAAFAAVRGILLRRRGHKVVSVSPQSLTAKEPFPLGPILGGAFGIWAFEVLALTIPLPWHLVPARWWAVPVTPVFLQFTGAALVVGAVLVYMGSVLNLGASWKLGPEHADGAGLVTSGFYSFSRHPIYLAFEMFLLGIVVAKGSFVLLACSVVILIGLRELRVREERELEGIFGEAYRAYCTKVRRYFGRHAKT